VATIRLKRHTHQKQRNNKWQNARLLNALRLLIAYGWENVAKIYAVVLFVMAIVFWLTTQEDPFTKARKEKGEKVRPALMQLEPLKHQHLMQLTDT
jgi:nitrate/nitrite transporter NarK